MILTVDIGNTTVRLCGLEWQNVGGYEVRYLAKTDTPHASDAGEWFETVRELLKKEEGLLDRVEGAVLCSVVPDLTEPLKTCIETLIGKEVVVVTARCDSGLTLKVDAPERLGADRLADAAWACAQCTLPVVTVDMGTATTFNVVDEGGVFLGGIIAPGLDMGMRALGNGAAQLPQIELQTPERLIGKNTAECMLSGTVMGAEVMIDGMVARIEEELKKPVTLVITGGLSCHVEPLCKHEHIFDPDLLAKGMAFLYGRNKPVSTTARRTEKEEV